MLFVDVEGLLLVAIVRWRESALHRNFYIFLFYFFVMFYNCVCFTFFVFCFFPFACHRHWVQSYSLMTRRYYNFFIFLYFWHKINMFFIAGGPVQHVVVKNGII